ncbi:MAG: hypothetical protein QOK40_1653, partial [Miltoncostaeaceae bacterium]|nr:hypothetical protein [Miltoncostaeaceae bacterium]
MGPGDLAGRTNVDVDDPFWAREAPRVFRSELTPVDFLRRTASVFPERTAVVHGERRTSYRLLDERVNRLASALRGAGVARHDRVAVLSPNAPALLEAHFGVPAAGAVLVAINTRLSSDEIGYILGHSGARVLLVDAELEPLVAPLELSGVQVVRVDDSGGPDDPYEALLASGCAERPESVLIDEEEPISVNYTSGTTGRPKGVVYTHRGAYLNALGEVIEIGMGFDTVFLWTLPMFHCNGWCFPWAVTAVGGTHVCLRRVDPEQIWRLLRAEGVTHYCGAPTVQIALVNHASAGRLGRRVTVCVAGAPPSPTLLAQMQALDL